MKQLGSLEDEISNITSNNYQFIIDLESRIVELVNYLVVAQDEGLTFEKSKINELAETAQNVKLRIIESINKNTNNQVNKFFFFFFF